jgi:glutaminyl-peptide cyclotransferase
MKYLILLVLSAGIANAQTECKTPQRLSFKVERSFTRSISGFTEGLIFENGYLLESTGPEFHKEKPAINKINVVTGEVSELAQAPDDVFEEGLTRLGDNLVEVTWKDKKIFVWDLKTWSFSILQSPLEQSWGISTYKNKLLVGYGKDEFSIIDPKTLQITKIIELHDPLGIKHRPNELEVAGNFLYANDFQTPNILKIDLETGCLVGNLDLSALYNMLTPEELKVINADTRNYVLNGIAYDPSENIFYITGKRWSRVFVISIGHSL